MMIIYLQYGHEVPKLYSQCHIKLTCFAATVYTGVMSQMTKHECVWYVPGTVDHLLD